MAVWLDICVCSHHRFLQLNWLHEPLVYQMGVQVSLKVIILIANFMLLTSTAEVFFLSTCIRRHWGAVVIIFLFWAIYFNYFPKEPFTFFFLGNNMYWHQLSIRGCHKVVKVDIQPPQGASLLGLNSKLSFSKQEYCNNRQQ